MDLRIRLALAVCVVALAVVLLFAGSALAEGPKWVGAFFIKGKVGLKWQPFEGSSEYRIYRKIGSGAFEKITSTNETQYYDESLTPGELHIYKIAALNASGKEDFSEEKSVTVAGSSAAAFKPPTWVGLREERKGLWLNWDGVKGSVAYNVYRSETAGGPYEVVGNTPGSKYNDPDVEQGKTYYYVLTAMNELFEETPYSEERSLKFGLSAEEQAAQDTTAVVLEPIKLTFLFALEDAGDKGSMNQPYDVFLNSKGDIYVSDTHRYRINCYDASGKYKFSFGEKTAEVDVDNPPDGTFRVPMPLFIDKQDQVYVGDIQNNNIQVFSADGKFIRTIKIADKADGQGFRPNGFWVLDDGKIIATDAGNHRLLYLDSDGKITGEIVAGGSPDAPLSFSFPGELVVSSGIVSVIDQMGARVQQFDLNGKFVRSFGSAGFAAGQFGRPKGIAAGEDGRLWVSDGMSGLVQVFTSDGMVKSAISKLENTDEVLATPCGMFLRGDRFYLVTRLTNKVLVFRIG